MDGLKKKPKNDREKISLFISRSLYDRFREFCRREGVSAAKVIEEFMREALGEVKGKK